MIMVLSRKQIRPDRLSLPVKPIKYLTENGFTIIRAADTGDSVFDSPEQCHFHVEDESGVKRSVTVSFADPVVLQIRVRRSSPLSERSIFWLVCAESCLARYLWEKNQFPPDGALVIGELPAKELMLALHWRDQTE
jgi:hypothetical protein